MVVEHFAVVESRRRARERQREKYASDHEYRAKFREKQREVMRKRRADPVLGERIRSLQAAEKTRKLIREAMRKRRQKDQAYNARENEIRKQRRDADPTYRLKLCIRANTARVFRGRIKTERSGALLGCTTTAARKWIESQLPPGWSWNNYGTVWNIDHVYPIAAANLNAPIERLAVCNYRNLRPLASSANAAKGDSVTPEARKLFASIIETLLKNARKPAPCK